MNSFLKKYPREVGFGTLLVVLVIFLFLIGVPGSYPTGSTVTIPKGLTVSEAGELLKEKNLIRSVGAFSLFTRFFNFEGGVLAGTYSFPEEENAITIAFRLARGSTGLSPLKVTFPEGVTTREMSVILKASLGEFDAIDFQEKAKKHEGYLFPETYFFFPGVSPESVIDAMRSAFDSNIEPLRASIEMSGRSLEEVVIMASLLEKEARQNETRRTVAGILWKRVDNDFPLQVDAVFGYIFNRDTYSPSFEDLEVDSPYNTYKNLGLPPGPITNPGLDAIQAALEPIETPYWYYLTGSDGVMHYSRTFDEHVANRRFLR
jgi:UPF0755 protein